MRPRAAVSWSGGKDSCAAMMRVRDSLDIVAMITMFDETETRSRSHGLRPEILQAQADRLGLRQFTGRCNWETYTATFSKTLEAVAQAGITHVVFGDIMFDEHRLWAERLCQPHGLTAVEPLWGESTDELFEQWIESGSEAMIVTARAQFLDETWLGRTLQREMADDFRRLGVDLCGERGEYHTLVTNTPLFDRPLRVRATRHVNISGCWALDVEVGE